MNTRPFISVIISVHRERKQFLHEAVQSVLAQTLDKRLFETIVVMDYEDQETTVLLLKKGVATLTVFDDSRAAKLVEAIRQCKGDVICFLEDDDKFEENKLEWVHYLFSSDTSLVFYHNSHSNIDKFGKFIQTNVRQPPRDVLVIEKAVSNDHVRKSFRSKLGFNMSSISIRKKILENRLSLIGNLNLHIDTALFFIALESNMKIYADDKKLTQYRIHSSASTFLDEKGAFFRKRFVFHKKGLSEYLELSQLHLDEKRRQMLEIFIIDWEIHIYLFSNDPQRIDMMRAALRYVHYVTMLHSSSFTLLPDLFMVAKLVETAR